MLKIFLFGKNDIWHVYSRLDYLDAVDKLVRVRNYGLDDFFLLIDVCA